MSAVSTAVLNRIHHGDCIAGMNKLPEGSIDLAFADPPFNIGYKYDVYEDVKEHQHYLDWSRDWISAVHRVLKPTGTFWLAIGDEYAAELKLLSQEIGFHTRSWVIWYYTFGVNCKYKFSRSHAHLFYFVKNAEKFTFRSDEPENRIPSARQLVYNDKRANSKGRLADDTWILRPQDLADCLTPNEDTWYFPRVAGTFKEREGFHGCQMPEQLLGRIERLCSAPGEIVLDPFAGSATTLTVAKKLGRQFLGYELSPEYVQRGGNRLANCCVGDLLEGAPEPLVSAPATPEAGKKAKQIYTANKKSNPKLDRGSQRKNVPNTDAIEASGSTEASSVADDSGDMAQPIAATSKIDFESGLVEAFGRANDGYSLDRLIADPVLNRRFIAECEELGLDGDPKLWNWRLFNYRKAGKLQGVPTSNRTELSWIDSEPFLFASEIALSSMLASGAHSLDAVLCDPDQATQFDQLARQFAPGFTSLQYRWAALKLRKEAKFARARAERFRNETPANFSEPKLIQDIDWNDLPTDAGLYLVSNKSKKQNYYAGSTLSLNKRLSDQFRFDLLEIWQRTTGTKDLMLRFAVSKPSAPELLAHQCLLVSEYQPTLNLPDLGA
ncbi:MAG: site-specific DNA-methyltransferase [Planctomycetia bacterium]|nr:site-specific DNA-methyltransferase [Planctomycetia bacterium]